MLRTRQTTGRGAFNPASISRRLSVRPLDVLTRHELHYLSQVFSVKRRVKQRHHLARRSRFCPTMPVGRGSLDCSAASIDLNPESFGSQEAAADVSKHGIGVCGDGPCRRGVEGPAAGPAAGSSPSNITQLTAFGERASRIMRRAADCLHASFGDAFVSDIRVKMILADALRIRLPPRQYCRTGIFLIGARVCRHQICAHVTRNVVMKADGGDRPSRSSQITGVAFQKNRIIVFARAKPPIFLGKQVVISQGTSFARE
jgi:hypothetical protein